MGIELQKDKVAELAKYLQYFLGIFFSNSLCLHNNLFILQSGTLELEYDCHSLCDGSSKSYHSFTIPACLLPSSSLQEVPAAPIPKSLPLLPPAFLQAKVGLATFDEGFCQKLYEIPSIKCLSNCLIYIHECDPSRIFNVFFNSVEKESPQLSLKPHKLGKVKRVHQSLLVYQSSK